METLKAGTGVRQLNTTIVASMLFCFLTTFVAHFKSFPHYPSSPGQQQIQVTNNFGQPAINLAKHKKSVYPLYI